MMAAFRLCLILAALIGFFLVGTPLQAVLARSAEANRIPLFFCRSLLRLMRVRLAVDGHWPKDPSTLVVANHVSWIDVPALGALAPFCFLAKSEIARWPVLSAFAAVQGTVFVDRGRRRSIPGANRAMAARLLEGRSVVLFPEGTTCGGPEPGPFRSSHFAAARDLLAAAPDVPSVTVQPAAIRYSRADAAWIGDDALFPHLWRLLRQPPLVCHVHLCTPVTFARNADRKVVARATRERVAAVLAGPKSTPIPLSAATPVGAIEDGQRCCA